EEDEHECLFCYPGIQMLGSFGTRMRAVREVLEYCACELPFEVLQIEDSEDVDEDGDTVPDEDDDDVEDRLITKYGSWKAFITEMRAFVIECWDNQDARLAANPDPTATRLRDNEKVQRIFMRMLPEQCIEIDS
ncbi:MAG: hypothetical protein FWG08_02370, partial [Propionibacteriaceae bacterium]|nr:hypothetical protein [Propionibacteriaceae bacterium]